MSLGIGGLTGLQTLTKVIIGEADEFKISDLKGLLHIRGKLSIEGLDKVKDFVETKEANLQQKTGLHDLEMKWKVVFDDSRNEITECEVLEGLRPSEKLTSLKILYYMGTKFPSWIGDPSFVYLTHVTLRGCRSCTCFPTLGHLPSLQKLFVESMHGMERLGAELLGHPDSRNDTAFPSLEVLEFRNMLGWVEWSIGKAFPCLQEISFVNCPKLDVVEIDLIPSLRVCHIEGCSVAVLTSVVRVSSSIIRLALGRIIGLTHLHLEILEHFRALENLSILHWDELIYLWKSEVEAYEILVSLQKLDVGWCRNLVSLGEKKVDMVISMESLREVEIRCCPRFESYNCPNHVEKLRIYSCGSIASLTFPIVHEHDHLPSTLKLLCIWGCDNLEMDWLHNNFFLSTLELLEIDNKPKLVLFPEGFFVHLVSLVIRDCDNIESVPGNGFLCLRHLHISNCKNLKSFAHEHLLSVTSFEELCIKNCPSMDESFPCGKWPPNLSYLGIGGLKKPISEWGTQNFPTSLVDLCLNGENSRVVTFAKAEEEDMRNNNSTCSTSFLLPSSLTSLKITNFKELESISKGMQHLTCLQHLNIINCPKLRDLPKTPLLSLSRLRVESSPEVRKKCIRRKGRYWPFISQIPHLHISPGED